MEAREERGDPRFSEEQVIAHQKQKATREWGDVAGTESLAQFFGLHALERGDVRDVAWNMGVIGGDEDSDGIVLLMEDGSMVAVVLKSNYALGPDGKGLPE